MPSPIFSLHKSHQGTDDAWSPKKLWYLRFLAWLVGLSLPRGELDRECFQCTGNYVFSDLKLFKYFPTSHPTLSQQPACGDHFNCCAEHFSDKEARFSVLGSTGLGFGMAVKQQPIFSGTRRVIMFCSVFSVVVQQCRCSSETFTVEHMQSQINLLSTSRTKSFWSLLHTTDLPATQTEHESKNPHCTTPTYCIISLHSDCGLFLYSWQYKWRAVASVQD